MLDPRVGPMAAEHMLKPTLRTQFETYDEYHRHPLNRATHKVAIPLIVFHILAMLSWVVLGSVRDHAITLAHVAYAATVAWYLTLDVGLGLLMAFVLALCFPLAAIVPRGVVVAIAVVGWLVQLAGHIVYEKRSPAFLTNLVQALIGPLFFVAVIVGLWPSETEAVSS